LLREEVRNKLQDQIGDEGEKAFFSKGSGSSQKQLLPEEKKKQATRIVELKKETNYKKCGKKGHWEREYLGNKKTGWSSDKTDKSVPSSSVEGKSKAHAVVSEEFEDEDDNSALMVFVGDRPSDDRWYLDGGATDHMTDHLEWFTSMTKVQSGHWPVMIVDNRKLWVQGVGSIEVQCKLGDKWEPWVFR
jgi:hypothetical protein